jgi:hypothetical protein
MIIQGQITSLRVLRALLSSVGLQIRKIGTCYRRTVVLVVTSFSVDVVAKVESGKELDKIRNREVRSGQECDTNQVGPQDNTTNTAMSE